jgi:hypothetical protein
MNPSINNLTKALIMSGISLLVLGCSHQRVLEHNEPLPAEPRQSSVFKQCVASLAVPLANAHNPATYHQGAKTALACLEESPLIRNEIEQLSVMQVHALAITQFLKAGDLAAAVQQVNAFKSRFPGRDLILEDGASFLQTVELIIGQAPIEQSASASLLNASPALKSELRRHQYWQVN